MSGQELIQNIVKQLTSLGIPPTDTHIVNRLRHIDDVTRPNSVDLKESA